MPQPHTTMTGKLTIDEIIEIEAWAEGLASACHKARSRLEHVHALPPERAAKRIENKKRHQALVAKLMEERLAQGKKKLGQNATVRR